MNQRRRSSIRRSKVRGVALIEALVGILIFAFGVIGLVGLQVAMTKAQGTAKYRADAAFLGSQLLGTIWSDRTNIAKYDAAKCSDHAPCKDWSQKVKTTLPAGASSIATVEASGNVSLTITWTTSAEGTHSHVLTSQIR